MLKVFRDNLKYLSWILWLVILVFVLFVFVDFGSTVPGPAPPTEVAASVGDNDISYGELKRAYREAEENFRQAYGAQFTPELARQMQLPLQVLQDLVQQHILLDEAERIGLSVSDKELQKTMLDLPVFQDGAGNFVGSEQYRRIVRQLGYSSPEELEESLRGNILLAKLNQVLADNIVVGEDELEQAYREDAERAKIRYIRMPLAGFRSDDSLPIERVEAHFQENIEQFRLPEKRAVDYLLVDADVARQELTVTDDEVFAYYTANSADYATEEQVRARQILLRVGDQRSEEQARQELEAIRARAEAGEDFGQLAAELSEDTFTATQGGEMAPFGRGQILPEVESAAFDAQVGEIVGPIKSAVAYHLLQILEHTPGGLPPIEQMQEAVRRRMLAEQGREIAEAKATELADRVARGEIFSGEAFEQLAAEDAAVSFRTTQPFGRIDNVPGVGRSTAFSEAAFGLEQSGVSSPVRVGSGWAILRLADIEAPRLPELAEVETDVRARLRDVLAERAAIESLSASRDRIAAERTLDELAGELEATVEESEEFNMNGSLGGNLGANSELAQAALALEVGGVGDPFVVGSDVVLFQVSDRIHFDASEFERNKEAKRNEIAAERLNDLLATVIAERRDEMEISYDPQMSEKLGLAG